MNAGRVVLVALMSASAGAATQAVVPPPSDHALQWVAPRPAAPAGPVATATDIPVLLVPGWIDTERDLAALRIRLISAGWEPEAVRALTFRVPTGSNVDHALEIRAAVDSLLEVTGARYVDIVAHSMGGLATRVYLAQTDRVRRAVFLGSPHHGTWAAYLAWGEGGEEMRPGSPFLERLNRRRDVFEAVEALTVRTPVDTRILPNESSVIEGVPDVTVCCPGHSGLLRDIEVFRIVRRFLADGVVEDGGGAGG